MPSSMSTPATRSRQPSRAIELDDRQPNRVGTLRRARREHAVRPVVRGRPRRQLNPIDPVESPQHIEVRESLDVGEPRLEPGLDLQGAFRTMLRAEALRNLRRFPERGANAADWLECAGHGRLQCRARRWMSACGARGGAGGRPDVSEHATSASSAATKPPTGSEVYGDSVYDRLLDVKTTYDPDNVFHCNPSIRLRSASARSGQTRSYGETPRVRDRVACRRDQTMRRR